MLTIHGSAAPQDTRWEALLADPELAIPPYPGPTILAPVRVPDPPLLAADAPIVERASSVMLAYKGAVEQRCRMRLYGFKPGMALTRSPHYAKFAEAALVLTAEKIAPAAWCMFSVDVWREHGPAHLRHRMPPITFVCSEKRMRERLAWFAEERARYSQGKLMYTDEHRALLGAWESMRQEVLACSEREAQLRRVSQLRRGWAERLKLVEVVNAQRASDVQSAIAAGKFVW